MTLEYIRNETGKIKLSFSIFKEIVYYSFSLLIYSVKHTNYLKQGEELSSSFPVDPFD